MTYTRRKDKTPPPPQAINNHRSLKDAVLAAENDFLKHNGDSHLELQFVFGTCDVTRCIHAESLVDPLLFLLDIFTFLFFLHIKGIIELGRAEDLRFIRLNATDIKKTFSTPWEHERRLLRGRE